MGRRDLRKVTQRKPKTKGKGDELIDWTIEDLKKRWKLRTEQANIIKEQLLHGMDREPENITTPKRRGITPIPSIEERRKTEEEEFARTHQSWQESNARQAYPADLPTSDAEFQAAQFNRNMQENLATMAMQGQISMSQAVKLSKMNGGAFETFTNMNLKANVGDNPSEFAKAIEAQAPQPPTAPEPTPDWDDNEGDRDVGVKSKDDIWLEDTANSPAAQAGLSDKLRLQARENHQRFQRERQASKEARKKTRNVKSDVDNKQLEKDPQGF